MNGITVLGNRITCFIIDRVYTVVCKGAFFKVPAWLI